MFKLFNKSLYFSDATTGVRRVEMPEVTKCRRRLWGHWVCASEQNRRVRKRRLDPIWQLHRNRRLDYIAEQWFRRLDVDERAQVGTTRILTQA